MRISLPLLVCHTPPVKTVCVLLLIDFERHRLEGFSMSQVFNHILKIFAFETKSQGNQFSCFICTIISVWGGLGETLKTEYDGGDSLHATS